MPVQFIAGSFKGVPASHQADVYRLLHVAFDRGYLFDAEEIEKIWLAEGGEWVSTEGLTEHQMWFVIEKTLTHEIAGDLNI
jgi:hypothetical protein